MASAETYRKVTDRIVTMLEAGTRPWQKPWDATAGKTFTGLVRPRRANGEPYRGINVVNLWCAAEARGFSSPYWLTYQGAKEVGAQVRKGAKSELAFYVGRMTRETDEGEDKTVSFLKTYLVFNGDEIENLPARYAPPAKPQTPEAKNARIAGADWFVQSTGAAISHGGNRAFYMPSGDRIQMPELQTFRDSESYYATLLHELVHWTGGKDDRSPRTFGKRFGDSDYAAEELVAELGAAFLCADLGLTDQPREDHASYLASWIGVLKADSRAIFTAARLAEAAAKCLHAMQPAAEPLPLAA